MYSKQSVQMNDVDIARPYGLLGVIRSSSRPSSLSITHDQCMALRIASDRGQRGERCERDEVVVGDGEGGR